MQDCHFRQTKYFSRLIMCTRIQVEPTRLGGNIPNESAGCMTSVPMCEVENSSCDGPLEWSHKRLLRAMRE